MRHGRNQGAVICGRDVPALPCSPLTAGGRSQVREAARRLRSDLVGIVSSPLRRAKESARDLSDASGLPILAIHPNLAEWRAPSVVLGLAAQNYPEGYVAWRDRRYNEPELAYEDGESIAAFHRRAMAAAAWLAAFADKRGPIIAVSHKLTLAMIVGDGCPAERFVGTGSIPWSYAEIRGPFHLPRAAT
jgi:probable phosphoglycerate mutase